MGGRGRMVNAPRTVSYKSRPHTDALCSRRLHPAGLVSGTASLPSMTWILGGVVVVGGWLGAEYGSRRFANPVVRRFLAVVLAVAGGKMVLV